MRIYNEIVFDVDGKVIYEDSYEYSGELMLCQDVPDMNADGTIDIRDITQWIAQQREAGASQEEMEGTTTGAITQLSAQKEALQDIQKGDIQLNPLPSLPSISGVGSVAPTGVINWNAIPGGFQPLPQIAGGKKKLYQLSKFHGGLNQKFSPRDISDTECQEATNVTVSQVGRIKLLGDCLNEDNALREFAALDVSANLPGYGLFQFTAPVDQDGNVGEEVILLTADGDQVDALSAGGGQDAGWIDMDGTDSGAIAQIYYAAGNGVYVADASMTNASKTKVYVYRNDINAAVEVKGWVQGNPLIDSPTFHASNANAVERKTSHSNANTTGRLEVAIDDTGVGTWSGITYFYLSWLFDNGCETGLTPLGDITFDNQKFNFNVSIQHTDSNPLGGDKRIEGARIYFKEPSSPERYLLTEVSLIDGIKGALDSTFIPWDNPSFTDATCDYNNDPTITHDANANIVAGLSVSGTGIPAGATISSITDSTHFELSASTTGGSVTNGTLTFGVLSLFDLAANILISDPPSVYTYSSLNGYYANEVYTKSTDATGTVPTPHPLRYKTAVIGSGGIVFVGNVMFQGKHMPDSMMFSMPGKPAVFPKYNRFDSPSSDGSPIIALASFRDTILQFKQNAMYVIDVSNPAQFYAKSIFRDCGVFNPCQVFTTSFGVIFVNKNGCFIYDGQKVISLTGGKFDWLNQSGISESTSNISDATVPCVGYDPRSQSIIVLKDIGDNGTNEGAWVYNMVTQSWTEGSDMITNGDGRRHTNFIITNDGYLAIKRDNDGTLLNYNHDKSVDTGDQTITYTTKDFDFGLPSQTKKIFKVYVTYYSDDSTVPTMTYGKDGATPSSSFDAGSFASSGGLQTTEFTVSDTDLTGIKSLALKINGATDHSFEIQDIAILYRVRPIK